MKILIGLLILGQSLWASDAEDKMRWLDGQRAAQNKATAERLAQLNFIRMKMVAIQSDSKMVMEAVADVVKMCGRDAGVDDLEKCHGRLVETVQTVENKNFELEQLILSPKYQEVVKTHVELRPEFERLVQESRGMFNRFIESGSKLRRSVGVRMAELRFRERLSAANAKADQAANEVSCRLSPLNLRRDLLAAEVLPTRAERDENPFLIVKAEHMLRQVIDQSEALIKICPDRRKELEETKAKAGVKLEKLPSVGHRQQLGRKLCTKLDSELDVELKSACKEPILSSAVMYSLDRELKRRTAK